MWWLLLALGFPLSHCISGSGALTDHEVQTIVSTNPFAASMSAENFQDPWVFNPKRWMDAENNDILDASQPFSLGSRICLGQRYASSRSHVWDNLTDTQTIT